MPFIVPSTKHISSMSTVGIYNLVCINVWLYHICQNAVGKGNLLHCEMSVIENYSCFGELKKGCQNCNGFMLLIYSLSN